MKGFMSKTRIDDTIYDGEYFKKLAIRLAEESVAKFRQELDNMVD